MRRLVALYNDLVAWQAAMQDFQKQHQSIKHERKDCIAKM